MMGRLAHLLPWGVCDPENFSKVELNASDPCEELTHPAKSRTSSLTTASRRGNSPARASQGCCACCPMKMLGHQNPTDEQEMQFLPHLVKPLDKAAPKAIREEKRRAAIGAGGDELEFTGTVNAVVEGHGAGEYTLDGAGPEENVPSGSQTPKDGCLRQPASYNNFVLDKASVAACPIQIDYVRLPWGYRA